MYWYKISSGDYPDEYVEVTLGHKMKYSKEEFIEIVVRANNKAKYEDIIRAYDLRKILMAEFGFIILPIEHQYHINRDS